MGQQSRQTVDFYYALVQSSMWLNIEVTSVVLKIQILAVFAVREKTEAIALLRDVFSEGITCTYLRPLHVW